MNTNTPILTARRFQRRPALPPDWRWPGGAGLALSFVLNIEEGAEHAITSGDDHNEGVHEVVNVLHGVPDFCMETHFEYGARCGYDRVIQRFAQRRWPLTLNVCGRALEHTAWVADDALTHGHELCGHGWRWESPAHMDEATERAQIERTVATITRLWGRAPAGWHCKSSRSVHTRCLLQDLGFSYDSDDYGDDLPYTLPRKNGGRHVVLPYAFDTNDMRFFDRSSFVQARDFADYVIAAIDTLLAESAPGTGNARMLTVGLHTRIIGRPARIGGLDAVMNHVARHQPHIWVARREDIARHWLAHDPQEAIT
ncbi:peptidoglycan/xylan/chitin deacetylase (PgdA/CDA1 family) [Acidovorax temperans]|uniref:Peptidoglycan/xylan/chitin deacetylase (PgdA/CDA1 family) n=1 Tax=Acidovorax temperans TaxID=80878 RepID=A0A543KWK1_9BURK|nr:polysaccharide deacetylase family protein [Acidovorax temperans]TQM99447.1 peptidoglycan/xylan/chitin deacetylase (PgdA/CDA1 family) [Acidovorax temperans]